jgi:glycosyltransferase involved in cell wall biosynthesis
MRLTIAIPTYNRNDKVVASILRLIPQLNDDCKVVVVDNASDVPVAASLDDICGRHPGLRLTVHRNRFNLGMCGNFVRCFELCDTEWLWILGDDDDVAPDAVQQVLRQLDAYPECISHNFVCGKLRDYNRLPPRHSYRVTSGLDEFIEAIDSLCSIDFISINVYHAPSLTRYMHLAVDYAYSMHNFVAMLFMALGSTGKACWTPIELIVDHGDPHWSRLRLALVTGTLLELPMADSSRRRLAKQIRGGFFPLGYNARMLLKALNEGQMSSDHARYQFHQACARAWYFECSLWEHLQIMYFKWVLTLKKAVLRLPWRVQHPISWLKLRFSKA